MENDDLELVNGLYLVREYDNYNEAHLRRVDHWQMLFPEITQVDSSPGSNNSSESSQNHFNTDSVAASIDHDPGVTFISPYSSSLIKSEDLYQEEDQNGIESNQSKLEDDKDASLSQDLNDIALGTSATESPARQTMDRDEDIEHYRIPSSVFDRSDSLAPAEWSAASNESLFSLHGGISFGKDQAVLSTEESNKSTTEESTKLDEPPSNPSPASDGGKADAKEREVEEKELVIHKTKENGAKAHFSEEELGKRSSVSCRSDASDGSTFSFAFPILASGRVQTSSTKGGGSSPNTSHSMEPHSETQPDNNTTIPPQPHSASKKSWFSCFSNCCFPSFCSCSSCCCPCHSSCWPFKS